MILSFWPTRTTANVMAVFSVIAVFLALGTQPISTISLVLVVTLVTSYTWLGFYGLSRLRPKRAIPLTQLVVGLGVSILAFGASRGWLLYSANDLLGIQDPVSLEMRITNSTISTAVWALAIMAIESRIIGYRTAFREKLTQRANPGEIPSAVQQTASHELPGSEELSRLQENLKQISEGLRSVGQTSEALPNAAKEIQQQVAELLRPLSHRIWFNAEKNRPQFHLMGLLQQALKTLKINVLLTVSVGSAIFFLGSLALVSIEESLLRTAGYILYLTLALLVLSRVPAGRITRTSVGLLVLFLIAAITILGSEILASMVLYGEPATSYPIVAIAGPVSTLALLIVAASLGQLDQDWKLIDSMVESSDLGLKTAAKDIRFASFLHNSLQSELNSIAMNLSGQLDRDSPQVWQLLERLEQIASESIPDKYLASQLRDHEYLVELIEAWGPLIKVDLVISPQVRNSPRMPLLIELAEESISNAVRHASASELYFAADIVGEDIVVEISHPAPRLSTESKNLGAGWLTGYSKDHRISWSEGRRKLNVVL